MDHCVRSRRGDRRRDCQPPGRQIGYASGCQLAIQSAVKLRVGFLRLWVMSDFVIMIEQGEHNE